MRTRALGAIRVDMQGVIVNGEAAIRCSFFLTVFDFFIVKLFHSSALQANDVIVMPVLLEFENGLAAFEVMAHEQAGLLELRQHTVHRGQADVFAAREQHLVDVFRGKVALFAGFEQAQHLESRKGRLEAGILEVLWFFHGVSARFCVVVY
jgi:hypothetical protein